jgi:pilus assembly protein Flp/PilA
MESGLKRELRHDVRLDASALRSSGAETKAIVTNLSLNGCCLIGPFRAGERVIVKIPRIGSFTADIRWTFMGRAGACFITEAGRRLDCRGVAAIEYAMLASLVAVALVGALATLGGGVQHLWDGLEQSVTSGTEYTL